MLNPLKMEERYIDAFLFYILTYDEAANAKKIMEDTKAIESEVHHTEPVKV